jgi:hypothetical protein
MIDNIVRERIIVDAPLEERENLKVGIAKAQDKRMHSQGELATTKEPNRYVCLLVQRKRKETRSGRLLEVSRGTVRIADPSQKMRKYFKG